MRTSYEAPHYAAVYSLQPLSPC